MSFEYFDYLHQILIPVSNYKVIMITEHEYNVDYFQISIRYKIIQNKINILPNIFLPTTIDSAHLLRLISSINKTNEFIELDESALTEYLIHLNNILLNDNKNYCTVCGTDLKVKGTGTITHCESIECVKKFYHLVTDNRVCELYLQDTRVFMFLLNVFVSGLSHPKASSTFKPLPFMTNINTLDDLKKTIPEELQTQNNFKLLDILAECSNDLELYSKLNSSSTFYCLLKNAISNNYFSMSSRENVIADSSVVFIHINYSAEIENKFQQNYYLFHGSSMYSWYPIIKNGLKVMSGTALQANGAAYGKGIYFSDSFHFSLGYSQRNVENNLMDTSVVGVFEILEEPSKYKKSSGIFVIADDTILLLRSLVITKPNSKIPADITNYFIKDVPLQKKINKLSLGMLKNKRLGLEYKKLSDITFIKDINIIDQFAWEISFTNIKNYDIKIRIEFSNYPISAPIIKLLTPIKIPGLVDKNNNILLQLTNPANWKITNNLVEINSNLYKCFCESL